MPTIHHFLQLPPEIITSVVEELSLNDILRLSETCQSLHKLIQTSTSIQYQIERDICGVVHGNSSLPRSECLSLLRRAEYNWATLQFPREERIRNRQGNLWELFGGVIAFSERPLSESSYQGLNFVELPSAIRGTTSRTHHLADVGTLRDFGMDPSQDLLVAIEMKTNPIKYFVKLLTISTGQSHPLASNPILCCSEYPPFIHYSFVIQVMGDYLGVLLHTEFVPEPRIFFQDQFYIWNWKTGANVLRLSPSFENLRYDSFSFISPTHFILSRFHFEPTNVSHRPWLEVYEFPVVPGETIVDPDPYRTFYLPPLCGHVITAAMTTRSDPSPGSLSATSLNSSPPRPFTTSPNARLLTICLELIDMRRQQELHIIFFVHQESLLSMPPCPSSHVDNTYSWDDWGPEYTRALQLWNHHHTVYVCYVHGTRFVHTISERGEAHEIRNRLQVLDFNQLSIRRFGNFEQDNVKIVDWETAIPKNRNIFDEDVVTSLPYRQSTSTHPYQNIDFMIDEDVLIGLNRSGSAGSGEREIVFLNV